MYFWHDERTPRIARFFISCKLRREYDFSYANQESSLSNFEIAVVVGSLRKDSYNERLAHAIIKFAPPDFQFKFVEIGDLPLYNQDFDSTPAPSVARMKGIITAANGVLFVTPEYNRSIPGVLKNAIDHGSRPYGKSVWVGKPAGIIGASIGAIGTAVAQQELRNILAYLDMPTLGQPEVFLNATDGLFDENENISLKSEEFLKTWMNAYVNWVKKHAV